MSRTLDELSHCYKCGEEGSLKRKDELQNGTTVYTFQCQNKLCSWFETGWPVQVDKDGSIPEPDNLNNQFRLFPEMNDSQKTIAQRQIDEVTRAESE